MATEFCLIGAVVRELLLAVTPPKATKDADVAVFLDSLADFDRLKTHLEAFGFERTTRRPYRLTHQPAGWVDLLPYGKRLITNGRLDLARDLSFNMAGFDRILASAVHVRVTPGLTVPVVPLPLYVLLFVAFSDRTQAKDLASVLHCLRHYAEDDDRRYGLDHDGHSVLFEHTSAYLLGADGRRFHSAPLSTAVTEVLNTFDGPDALVVDIVAREDAGLYVEDDRRQDIFDLFRWFGAGAGLTEIPA